MRDKHQITEEPCDGKASSTVLESSGSRARESLTLIISEWLKGMGLELKPSKTRLTHTLSQHGEEKPGFNFLGFNIRQHPVGKYTSGKNSKGKRLGFKTIITPSKEKVIVYWKRLVDVIDTHKSTPQKALIEYLNPIIRGWATYYRTVSSKKVFSKLDADIYHKLRNWATHRHRNKGEKWLNQKYWKTIGGDNWVFATREGNNPLRLQKHSRIAHVDYVKIKGESSPYDGDLVYWSTRMGSHPQMPLRTASLLKKQKGKCTHCGLYFKHGDVLEIDQIIPKTQGGKDDLENRQLLHRHCHDNKTANDGSYGNQSGCNSAEPKPFLDSLPGFTWKWIEDMLVMRRV